MNRSGPRNRRRVLDYFSPRQVRVYRSGILLVLAIFLLGGLFYLMLVLSAYWMERP